MPGASAGTRNSVGPSGATATTMITSATSPLVTNHFSPRMRQPPPSSGSAVVAIADGSEPARASVTA